MYIYIGSSNLWSYQGKIEAADGVSQDRFASVSMYSNIMVVGSREDDDIALDAGICELFLVYIFF